MKKTCTLIKLLSIGLVFGLTVLGLSACVPPPPHHGPGKERVVVVPPPKEHVHRPKPWRPHQPRPPMRHHR